MLNARRADALAARVKVLQGLPVTVGVPQVVLEQLAATAQFCPLPPGTDVVVQGDPADALYAIVDGLVVVHRDGRAVVHLGPGDSFGERGLLDHAPRNATVTTEMDTTLLRVEGHVLLDALEAAPALRPALDLSSSAPGVQVPPAETAAAGHPPKGGCVTFGALGEAADGAANCLERPYRPPLAGIARQGSWGVVKPGHREPHRHDGGQPARWQRLRARPRTWGISDRGACSKRPPRREG